jgi:hypothetical protein
MGAARKRLRVTRLDSILAVLPPSFALLTFPHEFLRPRNPLYFCAGRFVPVSARAELPIDCFGVPYGPPALVRVEFLLDLAGDFLIFSLALGSVCLVLVGAALAGLARRGLVPHLASMTLFTTVVSVFAWAEFYVHGLVTQ